MLFVRFSALLSDGLVYVGAVVVDGELHVVVKCYADWWFWIDGFFSRVVELLKEWMS